MPLAPAAIAAVPAALLIMGQTVQSVSQASDALGRDNGEVAARIRKAEYTIGGTLVIAALVTGDTGTLMVTAITVGIAYLLFDRLVLK